MWVWYILLKNKGFFYYFFMFYVMIFSFCYLLGFNIMEVSYDIVVGIKNDLCSCGIFNLFDIWYGKRVIF